MDQKIVVTIERKIGYIFRNEILLEQAFTRSSYAHEHQYACDNEVLEFIGDEALDYAVSKEIVSDYRHHKNEKGFYCPPTDVGILTDFKKECVDSAALSACIDHLELAQFLLMGNSDIANHVNEQQSVKEDLFEAILGAIVLDSDWDTRSISIAVRMMQSGVTSLYTGDYYFREETIWDYNQKKNQYLLAKDNGETGETLSQLKEEAELLWSQANDEAQQDADEVYAHYDSEKPGAVISFSKSPVDYVGLLQRYLQALKIDLPNYVYSNQHQADKSGFLCTCSFDFYKRHVVFSFLGRNQKEARQGAAQKGYLYCKDYLSYQFGVDIDDIEHTNNQETAKEVLALANEENAVSSLNQLFQITGIGKPSYDYVSEKDAEGKLVWTCTCHLGFHEPVSAKAFTKIEAKRKAAFLMIQKVPNDLADPLSNL